MSTKADQFQNVLTAGLHAALVVAGTRTAEARLERVVHCHRHEAPAQLAFAADEVPLHGCFEVVVGCAARHPAQMREGTDMAIKEAHLVLPRVEPAEVT